MIKVFGQTDRAFSTNGDVVLKPLRAKVKKVDNGDYYLDLVVGLNYADYMTKGNIVVADTPQGEQAFRIDNPVKTGTKIEAKCNHVFFDSKNYLIADSYAVDKTCDGAIKWFNNALTPSTEFTVGSDIATVDSYRCVRESFYQCIQIILERWGGHLVRDNFNIQIKESIGEDNGILVHYAKNLKEITCEENWDDVVTQLLPVGKDGTLLNLIDSSASIYMSSSTQYDIPYTKTVTFEQAIEREDYPSDSAYNKALVADLKKQAQAYLDENCVPKVNYTLKAHIGHVVDIGDTIHVRDKRLGLNLLTSVISFEWDCLTKTYSEIEFGNFKKTLAGLLPTIGAEVRSQTSTLASTFDTKLLEQAVALEGDIDTKVTKEDGMGLSSNDYTDADKAIVDSLTNQTLSPTYTRTSGATGVEMSAVRWGNVVQIYVSVPRNVATSAGGNLAVGQITNIPLPVNTTRLVAYNGSIVGILSIADDGSMTCRVNSASSVPSTMSYFVFGGTYVIGE